MPVTSRTRLTVIELNEFSVELLVKATKEMALPNLSKLLALNHTRTVSPDIHEHHGLDPWVQWVSIHTGHPFNEHGVQRHGDVDKLHHPQYWELLQEKGVKTGLWGLMNATQGNKKNNCFFLPDPWTYEAEAYPNELKPFLSLPRYFAKNYLDPNRWDLLKAGLKTLGYLLHPRQIGTSFSAGFRSLPTIIKCGVNAHSLALAYDILATRLFLAHKRRHDPVLSVLFLNLLAHCQHHFWQKEGWHPVLVTALEVSDKLLGEIFDQQAPDEHIIILNGLTQKNVDGDRYCIYRQINPQTMLENFGIGFSRVEPCMTNDCHVFFDNSREMRNAERRLKMARVNSAPLFHVETTEAENRLFYQIELSNPVEVGTQIEIDGEIYDFDQNIELICERTGAHIPEGSLYSDVPGLPAEIPNHQVFDLILSYFGIEQNTSSERVLSNGSN